MLNIPIVVIAYNRKESLLRLLSCLNRACYPGQVKLIISIDGGGSNDVVNCARAFSWEHGEKELIVLEQNVGLRNHVLRCGRLTREYDGIVLLEDDLYVSPHFYSFVMQAHSAYEDEKQLAGVALYSHQYNETARLPFKPVDDGHDVFFMQLACSWGQSWLKHQWESFDRWHEQHKDIDLKSDRSLPPDIRIWPASWKKHFIKYLVETHKYFVYPRLSLSTNFGDPGEHHSGAKLYQVALLYGDKDYRFPELARSLARYDVYCEIDPASIQTRLPSLAGHDFAVDLYGMKNKKDLAEEYVLTKQPLRNHIMSFGRELKPHELNVCENIPGDALFFGKTAAMPAYNPNQDRKTSVYSDYVDTCLYYYAMREDEFGVTNARFIRFFKRLIKRLFRVNG